jgi:hypothetical protein
MENSTVGVLGLSLLATQMTFSPLVYSPDLRWNQLGPIGLRSLSEGLARNRSVIDCQVAGNRAPADLMRKIGMVFPERLQNKMILL